jgi:YfiH family protein
MNLGDHVGDTFSAVKHNRQLLKPLLPSEPIWLKQVHGIEVIDAAHAVGAAQADASISRHPGVVCVVMTADCLPVLLCDEQGTVVAAVHAGWRGLCEGIIEQTVRHMNVPSQQLMAWMGPAIGPHAFEVGDEVRTAFVSHLAESATAFVPGIPGKWLADIYQLARLRLQALGIPRIFGGERCTYTEHNQFFSYRREGITGRMASLIWIAD